jgi:hypothetical protein
MRLEYDGRGLGGRYNPADPDDFPVLRLSLYYRAIPAEPELPLFDTAERPGGVANLAWEQWQHIAGAHYPTGVPATLPAAVLDRYADHMAAECWALVSRQPTPTRLAMALLYVADGEPLPAMFAADTPVETGRYVETVTALARTHPAYAAWMLDGAHRDTLRGIPAAAWARWLTHPSCEALRLAAIGARARGAAARGPAGTRR